MWAARASAPLLPPPPVGDRVEVAAPDGAGAASLLGRLGVNGLLALLAQPGMAIGCRRNRHPISPRLCCIRVPENPEHPIERHHLRQGHKAGTGSLIVG